MNRKISKIFDYGDEIVTAEEINDMFDPQEIKDLTMNKIHDEKMVYHIKRPTKVKVILAAALAALMSVTVLAVAFSLRDAARSDMGISNDAPIEEWREYNQKPQKDTDSVKGTESTEGHAELIATMCSGDRLEAYLEVSPVGAEMADALMCDGTLYEWSVYALSMETAGFGVEQIDYDAETQTALIRVSLIGNELQKATQVSLKPEIRYNFAHQMAFEEVVIPITASDSLTRDTELILDITSEDFSFLSEYQFFVSQENFKDLPSARVESITIYAGYIELKLDVPSLSDWAEAVGVQVNAADWAYGHFWSENINRVFENASILYKDGTSYNISLDNSKYGGGVAWDYPNGKVDDSFYAGHIHIRHTPQKPFDLSSIQSIIVGGVEYSFLG